MFPELLTVNFGRSLTEFQFSAKYSWSSINFMWTTRLSLPDIVALFMLNLCFVDVENAFCSSCEMCSTTQRSRHFVSNSVQRCDRQLHNSAVSVSTFSPQCV